MSEVTEQVERESVGGVFGVALGLGVFLLAIAAILLLRARTLEANADLWLSHFAGASPPAGFEFDEASRLLEGHEVMRLVRSDAPASQRESAETSQPSADEPPVEEPKNQSEEEHIDWSAVVEQDRGTAPGELVFVFYPRAKSEEMFATYFRDLSHRSVNELQGDGGTVIIESGELDWNGFRTNYVRQRRYKKLEGEPSFVDSMRVNLSLHESCVLILIWPAGFPGSVSATEAVLSQVTPASSVG